MSWRDQAACKGAMATMYADYPDYGPALEICAGCPVIVPCRQASHAEAWGVWGGTVPEQRGYMNGQVCHTERRRRRLRELRKAGVISSASAAS